ncbi:MAG TPA: SMP-30/gluconolactonase/LRE family protein, partial [Geminicoccaceae bacterium]
MVKVDCVLNAKARLGEAATWDDREQAFYWVDIEGPSLRRFDPATGQDQGWPMPSRIGCFALREDGGFVVALEDGFHLFDQDSGELTHLYDPEPDKPQNRFNDGTTDPRGRFLAGTMPMGPREPVAALYRLNPDLQVDILVAGLRVTNGSAFSP